jgi:hypothetical protein
MYSILFYCILFTWSIISSLASPPVQCLPWQFALHKLVIHTEDWSAMDLTVQLIKKLYMGWCITTQPATLKCSLNNLCTVQEREEGAFRKVWTGRMSSESGTYPFRRSRASFPPVRQVAIDHHVGRMTSLSITRNRRGRHKLAKKTCCISASPGTSPLHGHQLAVDTNTLLSSWAAIKNTFILMTRTTKFWASTKRTYAALHCSQHPAKPNESQVPVTELSVVLQASPTHYIF